MLESHLRLTYYSNWAGASNYRAGNVARVHTLSSRQLRHELLDLRYNNAGAARLGNGDDKLGGRLGLGNNLKGNWEGPGFGKREGEA